MGQAYDILGDYNKAIELLQQAVNIARKIKKPQQEIAALSVLIGIYGNQGNYHKKIELMQRVLEIERERHNTWGEANALSLLAADYYVLGEYQKGIGLLQQALPKAQQINISELSPKLQ